MSRRSIRPVTHCSAGALEEVEHVLMRAAVIAEGDPAYFNLLGLLHECRGRKRQARKAYGRAIRINSNYAPAQQNMRRFYELTVFGWTKQPAALGDEPESPRSKSKPTTRRATLFHGRVDMTPPTATDFAAVQLPLDKQHRTVNVVVVSSVALAFISFWPRGGHRAV